MTEKMDIEEFLDRLDLYGPDFAKWPAAEAQVAQRCMADHVEARHAHAAARELAAGLGALRPAPADAALKARIEAAVRREAAGRDATPGAPAADGLVAAISRWFSIPALPGAIAVAASAAFGFMISTGDIGIDAGPYEQGVEAIVFGDFDTGERL